jgi:hypothetical protein
VTSSSVSEAAWVVTSWYKSRLLAAGWTAGPQGPTTFVFSGPPRQVIYLDIVSRGRGMTTFRYTPGPAP